MILNLLFPRFCISCNKFGNYICRICRRKIKYIEFQFCPACKYPSINGATHPRCHKSIALDGLLSGVHYSGTVKKAIRLVKYRFVSDLVKELVEVSFPKLPSYLNSFDYILPVPLHPKKLKERSFNQTLLVAKTIIKKMTIPVKENILLRTVYTKPQFGLNLSERALNVKDVFKVNNPEIIRTKKLCLVDDVATTFSTLNECAKVLKKAGASKVWAIVLAHGN